MKIEYDGRWPNLCSGNLVVTLDGKRWEFPRSCLSSGGTAGCSGSESYCTQGPWSINEWPEGFPEDKKQYTISEVNGTITWGCCGGCI